MSKDLKQRILTAAVLIPLLVAAIFNLSSPYFSLLLALLVAVAAWEWGRLARFSPAFWVIFLAVILAVVGMDVSSRVSAPAMRVVASVAMLWWIVATLWIIRYHHAEVAKIASWRGLVVGWLVLVPAFLSLSALHRDTPHGPGYVLFLLVLIWTADSGAYFAGRRFGRRKLAPRVSPGKTWEGVAGGLSGYKRIRPRSPEGIRGRSFVKG